MVYFKIICDGNIVAVGTSDNFMRHQLKHNVLEFGDAHNAQFMQVDDSLYRDSWMQPIEREFFQWQDARILAIEEEEYLTLAKLLSEQEEPVPVPSEDEAQEVAEIVPDEIAETPSEETTADFVREAKIKELSLACNKAITDGFDIELSDGAQHHFSMTLQDQANLNAASTQILNGDSEIPYHADGEDYKAFSAEDMMAVIGAANTHKIRQLSYFGCLKAWVNGLVRISSIRAVEYGSEVPQKYQSTLYKNVRGGVN